MKFIDPDTLKQVTCRVCGTEYWTHDQHDTLCKHCWAMDRLRKISYAEKKAGDSTLMIGGLGI